MCQSASTIPRVCVRSLVPCFRYPHTPFHFTRTPHICTTSSTPPLPHIGTHAYPIRAVHPSEQPRRSRALTFALRKSANVRIQIQLKKICLILQPFQLSVPPVIMLRPSEAPTSPSCGQALSFAPGPLFDICSRLFGFLLALENRSSEHSLKLLRLSLCLLHPCLPTDCHLHLPPCIPSISPGGSSHCSDGPSKWRPGVRPHPPPQPE